MSSLNKLVRSVNIFVKRNNFKKVNRVITGGFITIRHGSHGVLSSPFGNSEIPNMSLPEYVFSDVESWSDRTAITCGVSGRNYRFDQIKMASKMFGNGLRTKLNLKKGDVVGLFLPNIPEFVFTLYGAVEAGFVVTFANPLYTHDEVKRQFENAGVKTIITVPILYPIIQQVGKTHKDFKGVFVVGAADVKIPTSDSVFDLQQFIMEAGQPSDTVKLDHNDLAVLPYSSGTTGLPKGVKLTHRNLIAALESTEHTELTNFKKSRDALQQISLSVLPFFHIYGFNNIMNSNLMNGMHLVTLPRFTPEAYIEVLAKYKPNVLFVVPSLLLFLASHPAVTSDHLASITEVITGAAPATSSLIQKFLSKAGRDVLIRQGYGMTESSPTALFTPITMPKSKLGSVGQVVRNTNAKIIDIKSNKTCGPNEKGELLIKGPQVMQGYLNNEKETQATIDSDGWLHTGDVAYYDDDQYFYIVDRTKELIKVKGNQVSPTELETIILQLPGVADVGVVGIPDAQAGEVPRAYVVLRPDVKLTAKEISDFVDPKVAPFKKLAGGVHFIEIIPRNPSGKILRQQLKAVGN